MADLTDMAAKQKPTDPKPPKGYNETSDQRPPKPSEMQPMPPGTGEVSTLVGDPMPGEVETKNTTFTELGGKQGKGGKAVTDNNQL